jgi:sugar/nucleoside kinase (ribokinase family)
VTDGPRACSDAKEGEEIISASPPHVQVNRVTGAGDTFMAAHIVGERSGLSRAEALASALAAAAKHVSGNIGS